MFFRCLLLVLVCLQDFTVAESANGPKTCCFSFQTHKIPVRLITAYQETDQHCSKPGVIFTLKSGREVCVDPNVEWVQKHMKTIDQRLYASMIQPQPSFY
ncbi:C-C motif chemokine 3-like isoform X2 [Pangasianodon hypophthalmus]|uniref:C-C motif chemokine 3-like isoform X2 n=1 Tax=Pangasianodon hypophthalmus TaxID=310915 RepID=UPI002307A585|nr:C-C motif chemokine 3-like isoform X2 [Pangasianodon hypophthalmus]